MVIAGKHTVHVFFREDEEAIQTILLQDSLHAPQEYTIVHPSCCSRDRTPKDVLDPVFWQWTCRHGSLLLASDRALGDSGHLEWL
jgi:hypothetical protein